MRVIVAESAGFCRGVRRAVDKASELASEHARVYTDGPLIHNEQMLDRLRARGIVETHDAAALGRDVLLVRAHGIPPERRAELRRLAATLVDCTCPDVARIQGLVRRDARRGHSVVVFGDEGHAEVTGLLGFAEGRGHLVTGPADVAALPGLERPCVVSQSTQRPSAYAAVAAALLERFPDATVHDTICESTRRRQEDLLRLAGECDALVVVGGEHSANTRRLVELARTLAPAFHVQTAAQIRARDFAGFGCVGLTAGASTPGFILEDVRKALSRIPADG